ncbi:MAG: hypothetical protein AB6733_13075 [Clostridiaceae bacterium]
MFETQTNLYIAQSMPKKERAKFGYGTLSLLMVTFAFFFSFGIGDNMALGDMFLKYIGCKPYPTDNGSFNYTFLVSLSISFISWYIGDKNYVNIGAKLGCMLSKYFSIVVSIIAVISFLD